MHWHTRIERGDDVFEKEGEVNAADKPNDVFAQMEAAVRSCGEHQQARISTTVQRSLPYGELKCSFTISVVCPQTKEWMDHATGETFKAAVENINRAMSYLARDLPPLNAPR